VKRKTPQATQNLKEQSMPYTDEEVALAKTMFERAQARGQTRPRAIAVAIGLSRPQISHTVHHEPTYRDFLTRARTTLKKRKQARADN
jgi:hypothetical protein